MRNVVMFVGAAGSGKDTAADAVMKEIPGCGELKFARALKETCALVFGWDIHRLTDDLQYKQEFAFYPDGEPIKLNADGAPMTRREIMQFVGTDLFRDQVRDDVWVRSAIAEMNRTESLKGVPTLWVLTDTRFENEYELMSSEAENLLVVRLERTNWQIDQSDHQSEQGWSKLPYHVGINAASGEIENLSAESVRLTKAFLQGVYNA